ncbi:hypothetical protein [Marinifilum caeruleilacunae]|uniref:Uncharacterized protein n=1 Tax=Marinifilum caeruleilacunae TaxID=2499076 RepID=A0ABX1WR39_9BACT|nr:hypothetical protein [Marinifilum caeruleilacunae]NOU58555.1 hypothetical protein [Marinifilum caeruleilacunae]
MEKSIETIWNEGFLNKDSIVVPKLNNLYNQKSKHLIGKFKRMGRNNLYGIVIGASFMLILSFFLKIPIIGSLFFLSLMLVVWAGKKQNDKLEELDVSLSSYDYLKSFDAWLNNAISQYMKIFRFLYPLLFLAIILGTLYADMSPFLRERTIDKIMNDPDTVLLFGLPIYYITPMLVFLALVFLFSDKIYLFDIKLIYGNIFRKLKETIADMEELRAS